MTVVLDLVYLLGVLLVGPFYLLIRIARGKRLASPLQRLGFVDMPEDDGRCTVWLHGVSVGEVLAARALVAALRAEFPDVRPIITSTTVTGLETARRTYPDLLVLPCPYDLSGAVRRFVRRTRPRLLVLLELELWPNTLATCRARGIPVVLANAKISERSRDGYARFARVLPRFLDGVTVCAQSEDHGARFAGLGLAERTTVTGNLKYDNVRFDPGCPRREDLRREHGFPDAVRILVAGSTHAGEEAILVEAAKRIRADEADFRLVLAPRHPERIAEVAAFCEDAGLVLGRRSRPAEVLDPACLLIDTMGELADLYGLADVAFVGGTLVPVGGHNLLEPAAFGLPLVVGPHIHTVQDSAAELRSAGALHDVREPKEVKTVVENLLASPVARSRATEGARAVIARHGGSARRTMSVVAGLLRDEPDAAAAQESEPT
ncbi:MAG: 3-deoxy-D-manno-octulosonic acid transferase [Planctomycetes bacterium]|nr:3-deoxy-D-manno-octulosonic acid transferase [Planctomycetota bacterium]